MEHMRICAWNGSRHTLGTETVDTMNLTQEAKVWIKQQNLRKNDCKNYIRFVDKQYAMNNEKIKILRQGRNSFINAIKLEEQQMKLIDKEIEKFKRMWAKAKG